MKILLPLILTLALSLAACAPSVNSADSPVEDGKTGIAKGHANLSFKSYYDNAKMTVVTSDGEIFNGTAIVPRSEYLSGDFFSSRYSSKAEAVLIGNKSHSMKCQFVLAEPSYGLTAGAIGECKISDGRLIPVTFNNKR